MDIVTYESRIGNKKWESKIIELDVFSDYYIRMVIEGRSSVLEVLVGSTQQYNWISFPELKKCCELATLTDDFWNSANIGKLINKVDKRTVIGALHILHQLQLPMMSRG